MGELDETVKEAVERSGESRLNSYVALLVALAATLMALDNVKDGNLRVAMAQAQAQTIDTWTYYQAKSTKQNLAEATFDQLRTLRVITPGGPAVAELDKRIADYHAQVARYEHEKEAIKSQAEGYQRQYDAMKLHDEQFDLADAALSVAIALFGVTALTQKRWLFGFGATFMACGVVFAFAGFLGWSLHPDRLMSWLS